MLKKVFNTYINPEVVGWVTYEINTRVKDNPGVRRHTFEVFSVSGAMILHQDMTVTDGNVADKSVTYIKDALKELGFSGEVEARYTQG